MIRQRLPIPENEILACGIALGYADEAAPENGLKVEKLAVEEYVTFLGFDGG